jgi:hypothetical protein
VRLTAPVEKLTLRLRAPATPGPPALRKRNAGRTGGCRRLVLEFSESMSHVGFVLPVFVVPKLPV